MTVHVVDQRDRCQYLGEWKFFTLYKAMVINIYLQVAHDKDETYENIAQIFQRWPYWTWINSNSNDTIK